MSPDTGMSGGILIIQTHGNNMKIHKLQGNNERLTDHTSEEIQSGGISNSSVSSDHNSITLRMKATSAAVGKRKDGVAIVTYHTYDVTLTEQELKLALSHIESARSFKKV